MNSLLDCRSGRSAAGGGARRLAALWLALVALGAIAHAYAVPVDDAVSDALDGFDDADDDELALDQEVRTVTDQRGRGESRKRYCTFSNLFYFVCVLLPCYTLDLFHDFFLFHGCWV